MTFASIAFKNVRKKFGSYSIYFLSTTFSVVLFHLFCSMYFNPMFEKYRFGTGKMSVLFKGASIAVFLFAAVFVMYAGSYFLKTQKKEIAIDSVLGMRKGQIAVLMFLETFFIGLLAVAAGTIIGSVSAGYAVSLLLRFMGESTKIVFTVEAGAVMVTLIAFILLFAVSGLRAYRVIYQYSLIELLSAEKQSEKLPGYSVPGAVAAVLFLAAGYTICMRMDMSIGGLKLLKPTFISALCILIGTYFLFRSLVPALVAAVKKREKFYYKTTNYIGISQIAFRLKGNARMFTVISLLTAITITMISASYSFYSLIGGEGTEAYAPFSYLAKNIDKEQHNRILSTISELGEVSVTSEDKMELINVELQNDQYAVKDQQTGEAVPGLPAKSYLMSESMYLKIIEETHTPGGKMSETRSDFKGGLDDTNCYFIDGNAVSDYCRNLPGQEMQVSFHGENEVYTVRGIALHKYLGALDLYKHPTIVVSDSNYKRFYQKASAGDMDTFYGFQFDDDRKASKTVEAIDQFIPARFHLGGLPGNISYIGIYKANFALFGSYAFIGFFLGALFSLASGSTLYYKLIIEAEEEVPRYAILRKTGMNRRELTASIAKQLGIVYGMPLAAGLLHTVFGLILYIHALGEMSAQTSAALDAVIIVLFNVAVYGVFYLLSVRSYRNIVCRSV